ncbi:MAG: hypothetical protein GY870_08075 [archaeon]|nr:hypothetical protein [archaeon]
MKQEKNIVMSIKKELYEKLKQISANSYPNESCALIFGTITKKKSENYVKYSYNSVKIDKFESSKPDPYSFIIEDYELLGQKWIKAQEEGLKLISIFHSHPSGAFPSNIDKKYMKQMGKAYPNIIWTIYGNESRELNGFILIKKNFFQCGINIV